MNPIDYQCIELALKMAKNMVFMAIILVVISIELIDAKNVWDEVKDSWEDVKHDFKKGFKDVFDRDLDKLKNPFEDWRRKRIGGQRRLLRTHLCLRLRLTVRLRLRDVPQSHDDDPPALDRRLRLVLLVLHLDLRLDLRPDLDLLLPLPPGGENRLRMAFMARLPHPWPPLADRPRAEPLPRPRRETLFPRLADSSGFLRFILLSTLLSLFDGFSDRLKRMNLKAIRS
ncbi:unnamed protein product [Medioppia subpectinata]|uniref:Uncharacterized protein n=1 Tax=Medioppia subpectinata TaxID=1979941 RepID=A0A7R9KIP4_9ACAR|nr:unnamed protein product [Medioppia subpectinata]CAG2104404.1 unnamed protein product [Medioppia subpectinata]